MKQNLEKELKELKILPDEKFDQVIASVSKFYENAEIDKNYFIITKEDLYEGNLQEKGIQ